MPSFPHLWEQSSQHILISTVLILWTGRTSLMTVSEAEHFCDLKISSEALLCAPESCKQLWFVLHAATCKNRVTTRNQFCLLLHDGGCLLRPVTGSSRSGWIPPCAVCHWFVLLPNSSLWSLFLLFKVPVGVLPSLASSVLAPFHGLPFSSLSVCVPTASAWHWVYSYVLSVLSPLTSCS